MDDQKRFELYEKLYFHEVEVREKISARLQIPLALLLSITSVYAVMMKGFSFDDGSCWNIGYWCAFGLSLALFIVSAAYFIRSFYGHTYAFIPSALETESYRDKLIKTYEDYENCNQLVDEYFNKYLFSYYNDCSSSNTEVNDNRSSFLHKCNTYLILLAIPLFISFAIFTLSGIDKSSKDKEYKIKVIEPISFKNNGEPIKINGVIDTTTLKIDFSDDVKGLLNDKK
jgi:hypothetical protein